MKRFLLGITILGAAAALAGCPIYPNSSQYGAEYQVCNPTGCYSCPDPSYSSACVPWACQGDSDCGGGYVCSADGQGGGSCVPGSSGPPDAGQGCTVPSDCPSGTTCGQDGACHEGDCGQAQVGCPNGYVCRLAGGQASCVPNGAPPASDAGGNEDTGPPPAPDASEDVTAPGDDASTTEASTSDDSSSSADAPVEAPAPNACNADSDCTAAGARCIDGACSTQIGLCSDTSQCRVAGEACVDGICEPRCSASTPCPTGYSCDLTRSVCNINPTPCTSSGSCLGGTVCVEQHCVPPCAATDGSTAVCPVGQVCVNKGCIPDQAVTSFACKNDGESDLLANLCGTQEVCLHHDCYAECTSEGGVGNCAASSEVCKQVTIETGTYAVCAKPNTLGSDCDRSQGKSCLAGFVCVDGYCL